jgi:hypothetical protein
VTAAPTPLQVATLALAAPLADARDTLDGAAYEAFVAVAVLAIEREAGRLLFGEALRALRGDS